MEWLPLSGCGTQHPHRALGGTCVLLAAAPTTPPCFRRWRRSSSLHSSHVQRKNYFKFRGTETPAGVSVPHFHRRGRGGKRHLHRRFLRKRGAAGDYPLSLLTAFAVSSPEGGAFWHLPVSRAKPPPFGGGGTAQAVTERVRSPLGSCRAATEGLLMEKRKKR